MLTSSGITDDHLVTRFKTGRSELVNAVGLVTSLSVEYYHDWLEWSHFLILAQYCRCSCMKTIIDQIYQTFIPAIALDINYWWGQISSRVRWKFKVWDLTKFSNKDSNDVWNERLKVENDSSILLKKHVTATAVLDKQDSWHHMRQLLKCFSLDGANSIFF